MRSLMLTGEQIRAARAFARIEQAELARRAGLSLETIKRLERIHGPVEANVRTVAAITAAFEAAGIVFDFDQAGVGVRLVAGVGPRRSEGQPVQILS
jgi:transcriptional regulator with XRE-family HTH domain